MPVKSCRRGGKPGYKFGDSGTCYTYPVGNDRQRREAKRQAIVQGIAAGERPAGSAKEVNAALQNARDAVEQRVLPTLTLAYEKAIRQAGTKAGLGFALVAAAGDWQPPVEGTILTGAQFAALAASLNERLRPIWTRIVLDVAREPFAHVEIAWDVKHPLVNGMLARAAKRTGARLGEAVQFTLRKTIADAYAQGLDVPSTSALIRTSIQDAAPWQAEMLARTDLNSLANGASKAAAQGVGMAFKTWDATLDSLVRPEHAEAHGQTVPIGDTFSVGGEEADYPGDPVLSDAMAANCFPAETIVAGSVWQAFRAPYTGELVTVMTRSGRRLAGTPNHPVLTTAGWKPLTCIEEGDQLVCARFEHGPMSCAPDVDQMPSTIEQVFGTLLDGRPAERIDRSNVNFHGDIPERDVDVVRASSLLQLPSTPSGFKPGEQLPLAESDVLLGALASDRLLGEFSGAGLASAMTPSLGRHHSPLLSTQRRHADEIGLARTARLYASQTKAMPHHSPTDVQPRGDLLLADEVDGIEPDDLIDIGTYAEISTLHASLTESVAYSATSRSKFLGDRFHALTGPIETDDVICVDVRSWTGQVFTLGTEQGYYIANGVVVRNCRCTLVYGETLDEANGLLAAALPADEGSTIMVNMTTRQRKRKAKGRRAAPANGESNLRISDSAGMIADIDLDNKVVRPRRAALTGRTVKADLPDALIAAAIGVHHTGVVEGTWDGNAAMGKCSSAGDFRSICAWVDSNGQADERQSYKFPHHASPGGPANIAGVRNALSRLPQANIPSGDVAGVRAHLEAHLNDFRKRQGNQAVVASARPIGFSGTAAIEGKVSDDNSIAPRVLLPNSLAWPEMPVSFMAQTVTAEGHDGGQVAGRVDEFARKRGIGRMQNIAFAGELTTPFGIDEVAPMLDDKTMRYVSADLGASVWKLVDRKTFDVVPDAEFDLAKAQDGAYAVGLESAKIKAVHLVPTQAIEGAMVALTASADRVGIAMTRLEGDDLSLLHAILASGGRLDEEEEIWRVVVPLEELTLSRSALTAAVAPVHPPREWFETPEPPGKMPLTVLEDGRVYGHLATWDSCHVGFLPQCVPPPKSPSNYARFHTAPLEVDDGSDVWIGKLMFSPHGGHADRRLSASKASEFYDRTGMAAAYLRATDGTYGIWVAGSLNPDLTDEQRRDMRRQLRLNPPSGDWRPFDGQYDLICGLAVAIPGFPVAHATLTITASAEGIELEDAIIASSGHFDPDPAALAALEHMGLVDDDALAEREMRVLAVRAEGGMDALAALAK